MKVPTGLHVESQGSGPTVVLVHGTAPPAWGQLPRALARRYTSVWYARRGFPPSSAAGAASLRRALERPRGAGERARPAGGDRMEHRWGHRRRPGHPSAGHATRSGPPRGRPPPQEAAHPEPCSCAVVGGRLTGRTNAEKGASRFLGWAMSRRDGADDVDRLDRSAVATCAPAIVAELALGTGESEVSRDSLSSLRTPTIWLVGDQSLPTFRGAARRAAAASTSIRLVDVPGSGHAIAAGRPRRRGGRRGRTAVAVPGYVSGRSWSSFW